MSFGTKLRAIRVEQGMSQEELAHLVGTSRQVISRYENAQRVPSISIVSQLAGALSAKFSVARDGIDFYATEYPRKDPASFVLRDVRPPSPKHRIPVLGRVPAGMPLEAIDDIEDWEEIGGELTQDGFEYVGLRVRGDSMSPAYLNGDTLIIRVQDTADSGDDAIVFTGSDDATFKRISMSEKGVSLRPLNPDYEPLFFTNKEIDELPVRVFGVVVEFRRKVK